MPELLPLQLIELAPTYATQSVLGAQSSNICHLLEATAYPVQANGETHFHMILEKQLVVHRLISSRMGRSFCKFKRLFYPDALYW